MKLNTCDFDTERKRMVEDQLASNGIVQQEVLDAFLTVPRHLFVPNEYKNRSYESTPLPIGSSQTISQPFVIAYMIQALKLRRGDKVLEVGTGSGYQTAILCEIGCKVYTVELIEELAKRAERTFYLMRYSNIKFKIGNARNGFEEGAPYDGIVVSAASEDIPSKLVYQLKEQEGNMIIPVGKKSQQLVLITKSEKNIKEKILIPVKFVPLI